MTQFVNYVSNYIHKHELYDKIKKGSTYQEVYDEVYCRIMMSYEVEMNIQRLPKKL